MSDPSEKPPNPFLKPATTKGSIFGGQAAAVTSSGLFSGTTTTSSVNTFLFGGASAKSTISGPPNSSSACKIFEPSASTRASSTSTVGISTFGNITSSGTGSAFTNTHSLFGGGPTSVPQSVFGARTVSEIDPRTSTVKNSNLFSLPSKPVVNVHSLFGNVSSTSEAIGINSPTSSSSSSISISGPFSSVHPATLSSTTVVSSTSLFGRSPPTPIISTPSLQKSSIDVIPTSTNNPFFNVVTANKSQTGQAELVVTPEQDIARPSEANENMFASSSNCKGNVSASYTGFPNPTCFQVKSSKLFSDKLPTSSFSPKTLGTSSSKQMGGSSEEKMDYLKGDEGAEKGVDPDEYVDEILDVPVPAPTVDNFAAGIKSIQPTAIICACISDGYLDKNILRNHFSKFGTVTSVSLKKMSNQAIVYFTSHESATLARNMGKKLHPNLPEMMIFFEFSSKLSSDTDKARRIKNNAVKFLRQNSFEGVTRARKPSQGSTDEIIKPLKAKLNSEVKPVSQALAQRANRLTVPALSRSTENIKRPPKDFDVSVPVVKAANFAALAQVKAVTSQEKYSLLDARDKLIRKQQTKILDVKKAQYLSATCLDMCPEKERYMREVQFDLSSYEMTADRKVDHKKAVKKFSRSSADKHEPLPHELRTGSVLVRTMDYLMCNIMPDLEEDSRKDVDLCYNYLWDRTRAMRSDIMQQHLLDESAVYVLERCVRFHIYCSERLCLEPPDVFDPKMNAEHLSKSLHSLKELYHDLSESSIFVNSEPEFRAYEILLNIDDGNIMFAYLHFRESVRKSPEVQFAVKVLHSVQTNNFVRFFRLVKEATFLQACILHKYFSRIRSKALIILTKAFNAPSKSQSIFLSKLTRLLLFEDPDDVRSFLASHGLSVNSHGRVVLDRKIFIARPEEAPSLSRAYNVIGSKKVNSVGEEINGGALPHNPLLIHEPCNSFSPEGYLTAAALSFDVKENPRENSPTSLLRSTTGYDTATISSIHCESTEDCISENKVDSSRLPNPVVEEMTPRELTPEYTSYDDLSNRSYSRDPNTNLSLANKNFEELDEAEHVSNSYEGGSGELGFPSQDDEVDADGDDGYEVVADGDEVMFEDDYEEPSLDAFNSVHQNMFGKMADAKVVDDAVNSILGDSFDYSKEEKVRDFRVHKLHLRCFTKWRRLCIANRKIRALQERFLCRSAIRKWQQFVARKKFERLLLEVRQKLSVMSARSCFKKWHHFTNVAKITKKNRENRRKFIAQKYFNLWWKKMNVMKWKASRLGAGFPAAPSRLSITEQNEVWSFNCQGIRCSYSRLYNLEEKLELEKKKASLHDSLSASICCSPLPVQFAFQRFIDSKTIPNTSKPKFFTLVICFLNDVDEYVVSWLRRKLNPVRNGNPVSINYSFKLSSVITHSQHVIQVVEAKRANISKISGISSVLYISDGAKEASPSDFSKAGAPSPNFKTLVLNKKECSSAHTSLDLVNVLLELYKNSVPVREVHHTSLPKIVISFISKHVFDVAAQTESRCAETGHASLPPQYHHALYERALQHLRDILLDQRLQDMQWHTLCPETQEPVIREMSEPLRHAIADALEQCQLTVIPSTNWTSWSEALKGLIAFVKREFDVRPSSPEAGLIENVSFIVHQAKQFVSNTFCGIDSDDLPSTLLMPWIKIYASLIAHKLHKLPDIDVICSTEDLESYSNDEQLFLKYLVPIKSLHDLFSAAKRKAASDADEANFVPKKSRHGVAKISRFEEELRKSEELEKRIKEILEEGDRPLASLTDVSDSEALLENIDNFSDLDSSLLNCIDQEKLRFNALEEKLLRMIQ